MNYCCPKSVPLSRPGVTLIEVIIAMAIVTILGMAVMANVALATKMAHANVLKNTAVATAQSFLEQIRSLEDSYIDESLASPSGVPLPTKSINAITKVAIGEGEEGGAVEQVVLEVEDPVYLSDPSGDGSKQNEKEILVDIRTDPDTNNVTKKITMKMWMDVNISRLNLGRGYFIEMIYTYEATGLSNAFVPKRPQRLFTVKSSNRL